MSDQPASGIQMTELKPSTPSSQSKSHHEPKLPTQKSSSAPAPLASTTYPQPGQSQSRPQPGPSRSPIKLLSTHLAAHPSQPASRAIHTVFPRLNPISRLINRFKVKHSVIQGLSDAEMKRWQGEGQVLRQKAGWKLAREEGDGVVVSELFWKMYLSLMPTLERDPLSGLVPPDLLGSTTTIPLSIISLIPDIIQHYRDVIIRAEREVFLVTNYWQPSNSVNAITGSLKDLSALVIKENRPKVVVKIMYDRGSWEQLWNSHANVDSAEWGPLKLPTKEEIPGLEMEVINYHRVLLGTFHVKFLVVDRKVALISSNNIQDRPNLELMSHLEGPVVDAFYEIALHSWYNRLEPPLPCINQPYTPPRDAKGQVEYLFEDKNPYFDDIEILNAARAARLLLRRQTKDQEIAFLHEEQGRDRFRDAVRQAVDRQRQTLADWKPGEELNARAQNAVHELREFRERLGLSMGMPGMGSRANSRSGSRAPSRRASVTDTMLKAGHFTDFETAAITAQNVALGAPVDPSEAPSTPTVYGDRLPKAKTYPQPQDDAPHWYPAPSESAPAAVDGHERKERGHVLFTDEQPKVIPEARSPVSPVSPVTLRTRVRLLDPDGPVVDSPTASSVHLPRHSFDGPQSPVEAQSTLEAPKHDKGEELPATAQMPGELEPADPKPAALTRADSEMPPEGTGSRRMFQLSKKFNAAGVLSEAWATVEDSDELDNFRPHIVHAPHDPFPIAMCCRKPHGFPGHHDIRNPQNAAWLAGFRYAKKKVFVQSPTLNARPIVRAVKQACRRGVEVVLLLDLGFNDKGESIPFQGGTNEEVIDRLYKVLKRDKKEQFLKVYWYTGKDQVRPLNAVKKQRNCHIKFAAYDDEVMIIGNGNQDSQSWFHSQEVNVMIDSKQIIAEMMDTLLSNQNTIQYGLVDTDGTWRDKEGKTLEDYGATAKGAFRGLSAFIAFAKSV